jgi:hypothetical protein
MTRPAIRLALALFAAALVAVPAASAKSHRVVPIKGTCSQQSTSKLKLSREDNGIEVEFQVDQNRNGVPWTVTLKRNGTADSSAPKGKAPTANKADDNGVNGHDVGDDNGHHSGAHA